MQRFVVILLRIVAVLLIALPVVVLVYRVVPAPLTPLMVLRSIEGEGMVKDWVDYEAISPNLRRAVIASEDARFCTHHGFDWTEIDAALSDYQAGERLRGASTITQQTAKNLFLWPGRSFLRKGLELPLALWIDLVLPKRRVLEIYLNIAEWGPSGQFGAEAGSRYAFNKSTRSVSPSEAALLAAVLPNPRRRSAKQPGPAVRRLAAIYQGRAAAQASLAFCARSRPWP